VDHGKTTLLDKIRGTAVAKGEPGLITQNISASYIPTDVILALCGKQLKQLHIDLTIPGLLWVDSPGHEAFTTLRKRGGAIADLAVLVVDINEGLQPQTRESIMYLKQFKTPFVVALTKIDRLLGWQSTKGMCFSETFGNQADRTQAMLDEKLYMIIGQLSREGLTAERFDRVEDFTKQVAIVPVSGTTGEGVPDLLMVLAGIAQRYLKKNLEITPGTGKGTILEVKGYQGLGTTLDVILYDGEIKKGDTLLIGGKELVETKVRSLLRPEPLKELKGERGFKAIARAVAAAGIKIAAPNIDTVIAGSPIRAVHDSKLVAQARTELVAEVEHVEFESSREGVLLKADTIGGLEALIRIVCDAGIPIRNARIGAVTRSEVMELRTLPHPVVFAFNVPVATDVKNLAKDSGIGMFDSKVIYHILERYQKWVAAEKKAEQTMDLANTPRPALVKILRGYVFRQSKPAVCGVEILKGTLRNGSRLAIDGDIVSEVKGIQHEGKNIPEAKMGDRVAISLPDAVIGKDVQEGDVLSVFLPGRARALLEKHKEQLRADERELLEE